jgi:hypothetical protein
MQKYALGTFAGLAIGWVAFSSTPTAAQAVKITQWEYANITRPIDQFGADVFAPFLNEQGAGGWELCDIISQGQSRTCIFKRVKL